MHNACQQLITHVNARCPLSPADEALLTAAFTPQHFTRGQHIISPGQAVNKVYFICSGIAYQYYAQASGAKNVCSFSFGGHFITELSSFNNRTPAVAYLTALQPITALAATCSALLHAAQASPAINTFFRRTVEAVAEEGIARTGTLLALSPQQRVMHLYNTQPHIVRSVPQHLIASYLGITPESYSRIKRRMVKS